MREGTTVPNAGRYEPYVLPKLLKSESRVAKIHRLGKNLIYNSAGTTQIRKQGTALHRMNLHAYL